MSIMAKTKIILSINLLGSLVNIFLNLIFVKYFSFVGAAISSLIAQIFIFLAFILFSQKLYHVPHEWKKIIPLTIIFFILYFFFSFFMEFSYNFYFLKIFIIFSFIIYSFKGYYFNNNEILRFKKFIKSIALKLH